MAQDTQLPEYPGTPSESGSVSDEDSLTFIDEDVQCVMMSGEPEERLKFRYDAMTSVGWLRRKVFQALEHEFALQYVDQVVLMCCDNALGKDTIKLMEMLDGPCGNTVQVLLVPIHAFRAPIEAQGRGSLHPHILIGHN